MPLQSGTRAAFFPTPSQLQGPSARTAVEYDITLHDKGLNVLARVYPVEDEINPPLMRWTRNWRDLSAFEMVVSRDSPNLADLLTLGNFIEIQRNGAFEALYVIQSADLSIGMMKYERDTREHFNVAYVAGQGEGTARDLVRKVDAAGASEIGRLEAFVDARDLPDDDFTQLEARADAKLAEAAISTSLVATAGSPAKEELLTVRGSSLLAYAQRRVVLPPPGTIIGSTNKVNITSAIYDQQTSQAADVAMKHYVTDHLISPGDSGRKVANLVNGGALSPPLSSVTFQARFQSVLDVLREIAALVDAGYEITLNGSNEFEFQVIPQRDRTIDSATPVVFREDDVLLDIDGRAYRDEWDLGDLVTVKLEPLELELDLTIREVSVALRAGQPDQVAIALDTPSVSDIDRFLALLTRRLKANDALVRT